MPHKHPEDRIYTVMSGVFYIGLGDRFDGDKVKAYPPGSVIVLPGDTWHFHWAKSGEYVTQVTAISPLGLEYLEAKDDPRRKTHLQSAGVDAERGPGAASPAGRQRPRRDAVDCTAAQAVVAALLASGMGNTGTASGPRPRLQSCRNSAHC
jgi:hypothetical protein